MDMRVAFVGFDFGEYCIRVASALAEIADTTLLIAEREAAPYVPMLNPSVRFRPFAKPRLRQVLRQLRSVGGLVREIKRLRPDVIHLQSGHLWFNCSLDLLRSYPLVVTVHDVVRHEGDRGAMNTPQWVLDRAYNRAAQLIVHAPQLKQMLVERLRAPEESVHVIPHVLCGDDAAQQDIQESGCEVLFFGRIWKYKGLEYLIRAEPLIAAEVPQLRIVIAGTGEDCDQYRRMMVHPDRFLFYNEYVSDAKRAELFRRASVVALPYIEASQSGVIPIAYRFGKPVVATTVGGLPAMVVDGETGFLVPPRDERVLARAIIRLLKDQALRERLGANGKRKINTECAPALIARETLRVYERAIQ